MTYSKRFDGRKPNELRPMTAKVGIIPSADGSALFTMGDTHAIAAVHGPRELHPRFLQDPEVGILRVNYDMTSFSVSERKRPGPSRRSVEISLVTEKALLPVLDLSQYPQTVVDVFIQIVQANAGTRCAGIIAASMALAHAGIPMKDVVISVSVGKVGGKLVIDLTKEEEDHPEGCSDVPIAYTARNQELTLLQADGNITKKELQDLLTLALEKNKEIYEIQKKALKEVFSDD